mmetsp:Transcript_100708/g.285409  ORF Transcript_100708/g.285409 Transcript_100708/m.285409 type:complete len:226 (+) Transcript_100708:330-1007(+)
MPPMTRQQSWPWTPMLQACLRVILRLDLQDLQAARRHRRGTTLKVMACFSLCSPCCRTSSRHGPKILTSSSASACRLTPPSCGNGLLGATRPSLLSTRACRRRARASARAASLQRARGRPRRRGNPASAAVSAWERQHAECRTLGAMRRPTAGPSHMPGRPLERALARCWRAPSRRATSIGPWRTCRESSRRRRRRRPATATEQMALEARAPLLPRTAFKMTRVI